MNLLFALALTATTTETSTPATPESKADDPEERPFTVGYKVGEGFILEMLDLFAFSTRLRTSFLYTLEDATDVRQISGGWVNELKS